MLTAQNLHVSTAQRTLLNQIDIELRPGEFTVILGANGAGKSTLLEAFVGGAAAFTHLHANGVVKFQQRSLKAWPAKTLAKRRAVMPQQSKLEFPFRVDEVVLMGRSPHRASKKDLEIVEQAMRCLDVYHLKQQLFPTLSGGEQQRVQLARVLTQIWPSAEAQNIPLRYLLLDECTSALDPAHQHQVLNVIRKFTCSTLATCAVMHDLNLAAQYGDRILLMKEGQIIADGTPSEVLTTEQLANAYHLKTKIIHDPQFSYPLIISLGSFI